MLVLIILLKCPKLGINGIKILYIKFYFPHNFYIKLF